MYAHEKNMGQKGKAQLIDLFSRIKKYFHKIIIVH